MLFIVNSIRLLLWREGQRSRRSVPLGAMSIEILSARLSADMNPDALVFSTDTGTPFDRHNLVHFSVGGAPSLL